MANTIRHINIIGHQNPDTDSICSALAYAWLKNRGSLNGLYDPRAHMECAPTSVFLDSLPIISIIIAHIFAFCDS